MERPDHKLTAIVEAAQQTFLAYGYDNASMDKIALAAGVSKRTVYNRFSSKEELFGATIDEVCRSMKPIDLDVIEASLPPEQIVRELSLNFVRGLCSADSISLRRLAMFEAERNPEIGRTYLDHGPIAMVREFLPVMARFAGRMNLTVTDPEEAIWRLGALITEPLYIKVMLGDTPDDLEGAIVAQVDSGLAAFKAIYRDA